MACDNWVALCVEALTDNVMIIYKFTTEWSFSQLSLLIVWAFFPNWFVLYATSESAWWCGRISWACSRSYDGWDPRLFQAAGADRHGLWPLCRTSWTAKVEARTAAGTVAGWGEVHPLGSPEGHPRCDEEADWLGCGLGTTPCCRESHGWAAGAAYSLREVGGEGQGLPPGQVSVPLQTVLTAYTLLGFSASFEECGEK